MALALTLAVASQVIVFVVISKHQRLLKVDSASPSTVQILVLVIGLLRCSISSRYQS